MSYTIIIMLVVLVIILYLVMIRPENKKKKATEEMRNNLKVGDVITTIGGIVGTICAIKEETIVIETGADRVRIEFAKWGVSSKGKQTDENTVQSDDNTDNTKISKKASK